MSEQQTEQPRQVATREQVLQVLTACGEPDMDSVVQMALVASSLAAQAGLAKLEITGDNLIETHAAIVSAMLCIVAANLGYSDDEFADLLDATLGMYTNVMQGAPGHNPDNDDDE